MESQIIFGTMLCKLLHLLLCRMQQLTFEQHGVRNTDPPGSQKSKYHLCAYMLVTELCLTLCNNLDCSPPGSSIYGIIQAGILEQTAISFSRGSPRPRDLLCLLHWADSFPLASPGKHKYNLQLTLHTQLLHLDSFSSSDSTSHRLGSPVVFTVGKKKNAYKWASTIQAPVVRGSTVQWTQVRL